MSQSIVSQIKEGICKAERMMADAHKRGDVETYHSLQVQYNALQRQLERAKRGEYATLESGK
jgi:hypothetical protein